MDGLLPFQLQWLIMQATTSLLTASSLQAREPQENTVSQSNSSTAPEYFVTVTNDGDFALGCQTFHPVGWNQ